MDEGWLHVVFGTGQVGLALAACLAGRGIEAPADSARRWGGVAARRRHRPPGCHPGTQGAAVVYQCLNAPYTQWPTVFPPLQRGVLTAAESTGALLAQAALALSRAWFRRAAGADGRPSGETPGQTAGYAR
jgi:hypothetical protein